MASNRISLGALHNALKIWLSEKVRIDRWNMDVPANTPIAIRQVFYPANVARALPSRAVTFERSNSGSECSAEFNFQIIYRFPKQLGYDALPIALCEDVLNNLYLMALESPQDISSAVRSIRTPSAGVDVVVQRESTNPSPDSQDSGDWLLMIQPQFSINFMVGLANLDGIQPGDGSDLPIVFNRLDIAIFRSKVGDLTANQLDRILRIDN